ncbi:MAG: PKD domain-containing protein [Reichenbachiella sp.]|uniref:PKD domain-containing protein n=1 Tax=Reichenbachiella sp. TaxID=2184521 RepID=UPI00326732FD
MMKKILLSTFIVLSSVTVFAQIPWPFPNSLTQGRVTGTIGEIRGAHRFHRGNDLKADDLDEINTEKSVHAIENGNVKVIYINNIYSNGVITENVEPYTSYIRVGEGQDLLDDDIYYYHIYPIDGLEIGAAIAVGDHIGEMYTDGIEAHLHLQTKNTNYLSELIPYVDNHIPEFDDTYLNTFDGVEFYRNGIIKTTTNQANFLLNDRVQIDNTEYLMLYDKIDIAAHIKDEKTDTSGEGAGGNTSPYLITLDILNESGSEVFNQEIRFDGTPVKGNGLYCFHPDSHSPNRSINILTADPYEGNAASRDQFINTRLTRGQTESYRSGDARADVLDAKVNSQSSFPDGIYDIDIGGCDLDFFGLRDNCLEDKRVPVVIDNFKPYIESVTMRYSEDDITYTTGYEGSWSWSNEQLIYSNLGEVGFLPTDFIQIWFTTSEPLSMESGYIPSISIASVDDPLLLSNSSDNKTFIFTIPPGTFLNDGSDDGEYTLEINGYDMTKNQITGFDQLDNYFTAEELPIKNSSGNWPTEALVSKPDVRHGFSLGSGCDGFLDGRVLSGDCNPLIADFNHRLDPSEPRDVQFSDLSSPQGEITNWTWDFGDGSSASTNQNPFHEFENYGIYLVTLTVNMGNAQDFRTQIVSVSGEPLQASFSISPNTGTAPFNVQLDARSSIGNIVDYQWSITPSTGFSYISSNENSRIATISINKSGEYNIALEVSDLENTHQSEVKTITAGNGAKPVVDFAYEGTIYNGLPTQFFERANVNCVSDLVFEWTFEGGSPATSMDENPWVEFSEAGSKTVELCVTDGCGVKDCMTPMVVEVENRNLVNSGIYAQFDVVWPNSDNYFNKFDIGDKVEFLDKSFTLGKTIEEWTWWFELPSLPPELNGDHSGPSYMYGQKLEKVDHIYNVPGKYVVRQYVWEDIGIGPSRSSFWDEIIIIRRPSSFCEEETLLTDQDIEAGEVRNEITGILKTGTGGAGIDFNAKDQSSVTLQGTSIQLRTGTHLQNGSTVHILPKDCDDLRETF